MFHGLHILIFMKQGLKVTKQFFAKVKDIQLKSENLREKKINIISLKIHFYFLIIHQKIEHKFICELRGDLCQK